MTGLRELPVRLAWRAVTESRSLAEITRAGIVTPEPPARLRAILRALRERGQIGAAITSAAIRHGDRPGLIDELGTLTFAELEARSDALACGMLARGVSGQDCVGILCRNHRGFFDATFAAGKLGSRILYLNTDFAGPSCAMSAAARAYPCSCTTRSTPSSWPRSRRHGAGSWPGRTARVSKDPSRD